jgi:hypothetical protein
LSRVFELGLLDEAVEFSGEALEGLLEAVGDGADGGFQRSPGGAEDSQVELGAEQSDLESESGQQVVVRAFDAGDHASAPEASQSVGHLSGSVVGIAEQGGDLGAKIAMTEALPDAELRGFAVVCTKKPDEALERITDPRIARIKWTPGWIDRAP